MCKGNIACEMFYKDKYIIILNKNLEFIKNFQLKQ